MKRLGWLPVLLCLLGSCGEPPSTPSRERPISVLLITSDTTRSDLLSCYGSDRSRMPNLDAMVREGALFQNHRATTIVTIPTHASILTGLFPDRHGLQSNEAVSLRPLRTVATVLTSAGYRTSCYFAAGLLQQIAAGFQEIHYRGAGKGWRRTGEFVDQLIEQMRALRGRDEPYFLWFHSFDPHFPYAAPDRIPDPNALVDFEAISPHEAWGHRPEFPPEFARNQYRGELSYWDRVLGRILQEASAHERLLVVFVGDHGENLGEGGQFGHFYPTQQVLSTPLCFWSSDKELVPAGRVISYPVQQVDIAPTILSILNRPGELDTEGQDLTPWLQGRGEGASRTLFSIMGYIVTAEDIRSGIKIRQTFPPLSFRTGLGPGEARFTEFTDTILEANHRMELELQPEEGDFWFDYRYSGKTDLPGIDRVEIPFGWRSPLGGVRFICASLPCWDGEFEMRFSQDRHPGDNYHQLYGEEAPWEVRSGQEEIYALRFLSGDRLVWQSPWIRYRVVGLPEASEDQAIRVIRSNATQEVEVGEPYRPGQDPTADRLVAEIRDFVARQEIEPRMDFKLERKPELILPSLADRPPDQIWNLYEIFGSAGSLDTSRTESELEVLTEDLRSLGYVN